MTLCLLQEYRLVSAHSIINKKVCPITPMVVVLTHWWWCMCWQLTHNCSTAGWPTRSAHALRHTSILNSTPPITISYQSTEWHVYQCMECICSSFPLMIRECIKRIVVHSNNEELQYLLSDYETKNLDTMQWDVVLVSPFNKLIRKMPSMYMSVHCASMHACR